MKKLANLKGAKALNKKEQQSIHGGGGCPPNSCANKNAGDKCALPDCSWWGFCVQDIAGNKACVSGAP